MDKKNAAKHAALCGLLGALALSLSYLEGLLPPLPGIPPGAKPGLSNLAVLAAADLLGLPAALSLAVLKGGFAFLTRGVTPGIMSLSGGLLSAPAMTLILRKTKLSPLFAGVTGALAHNAAQLAAARFLTGPAAWGYAPGMLLLGVVSGLLTGACFSGISAVLEKAFGHRTP